MTVNLLPFLSIAISLTSFFCGQMLYHPFANEVMEDQRVRLAFPRLHSLSMAKKSVEHKLSASQFINLSTTPH